MPKGTSKTVASSSTEEPKAKRKMLTAEERVALLEAQLAEAKAKADAKANKVKTEAKAKRATLIERRDKLNAQIAELDAVIGDETEAPAEG